jgi:hypothetical protein
MKKIILLLLLVLSTTAYSQVGQDVKSEVVLEESFTIDSSATSTFYSKLFSIYSDTLSFQIEVTSADSLDAANPLSGDSLTIAFKILPLTVNGLQDTTSVTYWTTVVSKGAKQGRAAFGDNVALTSSKQFRAKGYMTVTSAATGKQKVKIRVYSIRKWRR